MIVLLPAYLLVCLPVCLSACLSIRLSVRLSVPLSVRLSVAYISKTIRAEATKTCNNTRMYFSDKKLALQLNYADTKLFASEILS